MSEEIKETAGGELTQGDFKIKKKPRKLISKDIDAKVDFSKKPVEETVTKLEIKNEEEKEEVSNPIEEVVKSETVKQEEVIEKPKRRIVELPEDLEKVVHFMNDTGGSLQDYVRLNRDYSNIDEKTLLKEYYKNTKPHLDSEEVEFIMEDNFSYDEDMDEERDIKKKKLAMKEEVAKAKSFLEETKSKYYEEIKLKPNVTQDQQKAMDFFNRYNDEQKQQGEQQAKFINTTNEYFSENFKGFEFNLGDKTFNYGINNKEEIAKDQAELTGFTKKFLNEDGSVKDPKEYHKALYAAKNVDTIAQHFYEQGKTDGIKNIVNKSKNIDTASRPQDNSDIFINGFKVKAISGVDSSKLKIKSKK